MISTDASSTVILIHGDWEDREIVKLSAPSVILSSMIGKAAHSCWNPEPGGKTRVFDVSGKSSSSAKIKCTKHTMINLHRIT